MTLHQPLVYAADVDLLGYNINSTKTNTDALNDTSKEVGPEVNTKKIYQEHADVVARMQDKITT
jgi:hypothetical protein